MTCLKSSIFVDFGAHISNTYSPPWECSGQNTPQMCYILGLGGCRARDDHAAPRLAGETCSILANQPQLGLAAADPPESGFVGSAGLGLQYVRVSRADEMRRGVRGRRTEGRFSADRPVHESPQKMLVWKQKSKERRRNKKVALELFQHPRARAQCDMCLRF